MSTTTSTNTNGALVVALIAVVALVIVGLFVLAGSGAMTGGSFGGGVMTGGGHGGGAMTGGRMGEGVTGSAWKGGLGWMWIPAVLTVGLGALLAWGILGKKQ